MKLQAGFLSCSSRLAELCVFVLIQAVIFLISLNIYLCDFLFDETI